MHNQIEVLKVTRQMVYNTVKDLSLKEIHIIPNGFNNNIAWNIAHLVVTQQLLQYKLSGLNCLVSDELIQKYRKGTKPSEELTQEQWEDILTLFLKLPKTFEEHFKEEAFKTYNQYETSSGFVIKNIEGATAYNNHHEGIHYGSILALRKLIF